MGWERPVGLGWEELLGWVVGQRERVSWDHRAGPILGSVPIHKHWSVCLAMAQPEKNNRAKDKVGASGSPRGDSAVLESL